MLEVLLLGTALGTLCDATVLGIPFNKKTLVGYINEVEKQVARYSFVGRKNPLLCSSSSAIDCASSALLLCISTNLIEIW